MWQLAHRIQSSNNSCLKSVLHGQVPVHNSRTPYIAHQPITIPNQTSAGCYRSSRCQEARDDIHDALSRHIITVEPDELSVVCMDTTDIDNTAFTAKFVVSRQPQDACMDIGHMYEYEHERLLSTNSTEKIIATALVLVAQTHDTLTNSIDHNAHAQLITMAAELDIDHQRIWTRTDVDTKTSNQADVQQIIQPGQRSGTRSTTQRNTSRILQTDKPKFSRNAICWGGGIFTRKTGEQRQTEADNETYIPFSTSDEWLSNSHIMHCTLYLLHMHYPIAAHQNMTGVTHSAMNCYSK